MTKRELNEIHEVKHDVAFIKGKLEEYFKHEEAFKARVYVELDTIKEYVKEEQDKDSEKFKSITTETNELDKRVVSLEKTRDNVNKTLVWFGSSGVIATAVGLMWDRLKSAF